MVGGGSALNPVAGSYGPLPDANCGMGVKKRLDSSSRIAPEVINNPGQLKNHTYTNDNISPNHVRI